MGQKERYRQEGGRGGAAQRYRQTGGEWSEREGGVGQMERLWREIQGDSGQGVSE